MYTRPRINRVVTLGIMFLLVAWSFDYTPKTYNRNHSQNQEVINVNTNINLGQYFRWMDSVIGQINATRNYEIDEYVLVHANPWIIDSLRHTDYYYLKDRDIFSENSRNLVVLPKGENLEVPDSLRTLLIYKNLSNTYLSINIPEFRLRIYQYEKEIFEFPVRVGQNKKKYLEMAQRKVDLRTRTGAGSIVRVNKNPIFINPSNNNRYYISKRDNGQVTQLPIIPWLEPEIEGIRYGQLIHPTTNIETLNKASSNGCVGLREADAWVVYYYAPVKTKVLIRYDLEARDSLGGKIELKDIYPDHSKLTGNKEISHSTSINNTIEFCDCRVIEGRY